MLALIVTLAVTMGPAYAINATVDVPYENFQLTGCSDQFGTYTCQWIRLYESPTDETPLTPTDETVDEETVTDEIVDEPEDKLTNEQKAILRIIDKIETDLAERPDSVPNADRQLLILLKRAQDVCEFGVLHGAPIQTYALFGIPQGNLYIDDTDFSKYVTLGKIAKLIQACEAWDKYRVSHLGQQYLDIETENRLPPGLNQTFIDAFMVNITKTDEYMNRAINPHDFIEAEDDAEDFMCSIEGRQRGLCGKGFSGINQGGYVDTTNNPALAKYYQYLDAPEQAKGEPRYDVTTNAKCAVLSAYVKQYELSEESRDIIMREAGCKID